MSADGGPAPQARYTTIPAALIGASESDSGGLVFLDLRENETNVSWRELRQSARWAAFNLAAKGIAPGDCVPILGPTSPAFMAGFFGLLLAGAIPVPIAPPLRIGRRDAYLDQIRRMMSAIGSKHIVADAQSARVLAENEGASPLPVHLMDAIATKGEGELELTAEPDALAFLQFSSGSTVDPKPVALTHRQVTLHCAILAAAMPDITTTVSWLPLYHDMGLTGCLLQSLCSGGKLVIFSPDQFVARPSLWLRAIARHHAQFTTAPNFAYAMCIGRVSDEDMAGADLSQWKFALNGAEPINGGLFRKFGERFAPFGLSPSTLAPTYGLAEATLAVSLTPRARGIKSLRVDPNHLAKTGTVIEGTREIVSCGIPYPGVTIEIRDDAQAPLPDRTAGHIWALSPTNMACYYKNEAATARTLVNGWLNTGDLGFLADGELYISGRAKDIVIVRGGNHSPEEFEDALVGLAGIRAGACAAVGFQPEGSAGEELCILVEPLAGTDEEAVSKQIADLVLELTGIRPHTVAMVQRGSLPRTTSGKIRRAEALRLFLAGELRGKPAA